MAKRKSEDVHQVHGPTPEELMRHTADLLAQAEAPTLGILDDPGSGCTVVFALTHPVVTPEDTLFECCVGSLTYRLVRVNKHECYPDRLRLDRKISHPNEGEKWQMEWMN